MTNAKLASIVMPAYHEGEGITQVLDRLLSVVHAQIEVLVVLDSPDDPTKGHLDAYEDPRVHVLLNPFGPGACRAIRAGMASARGDVVVVTMADGSDDPAQIDAMIDLVRGGHGVVSASRYMPGGKQIGGPMFKRLLSRTAGLTLYHLAGVGTRDSTSAFKAFDRRFLESVAIESDAGFEIALELVVKATRMGVPVVEVPTVWRDRESGSSNFRLMAWLPRYLHWYRLAFRRSPRSSSRNPEDGSTA